MRSVVSKILMAILAFTFVSPISAQIDKGIKVVDVGSRLEIFTDYFLLDELNDVSLKLHAPIDKGSVLKFDKPWEGPFSGYCTVIKDGDLYRLYYRGLPTAGHDGRSDENTCYAESKDGINWIKPNLKIHSVNGSSDNNVMLSDIVPVTHNFSPFLDTRKGVESKHKFKGLGGTYKSGMIPYTSEDGIHWFNLQKEPVIMAKKGDFDSQNVSFWSEEEQLYICYYRTWVEDNDVRYRTVARTTSKDFINWSAPVEMTYGDRPFEQLYTNQTSPYYRAPHIYVSVAARFMPKRQVLSDEEAQKLDVNPKYFKDCSDAIFMTTRGNDEYNRTFMESFIRPGIGLKNWVSRSNYPALNIVQTSPTEMSVYVNQDYAQPTAHLHRYAMRIDGFTSIHAPFKGGEFITKPIEFTGKKLMLNFSTSAAGFVKVEMLDVNGDAIKGFELENSIEVIGNEIEKTVTWQGNPDLEKLARTSVRLRFVMKDADLYSMRFK